ncbi:MAG: DUF1847 domain-containing protein [Candidatus Lokiarchaeia archaeon]
MKCAYCTVLVCIFGGGDTLPAYCPMRTSDEVMEKAKEIYNTDPEIRELARQSSIVEATGYMEWPRLRDTIEFAQRMNYKKLGVAFCIGLHREAGAVSYALEGFGFDVVSVCCKTGALYKKELDLSDEYIGQSKTGYLIGEISCNPVAQALYLNEQETEMNILVGLCVGHDVLFTKFSEAGVTTLIAKDRVLAHNPAGAINTYYYSMYFGELQKKMNQK